LLRRKRLSSANPERPKAGVKRRRVSKAPPGERRGRKKSRRLLIPEVLAGESKKLLVPEVPARESKKLLIPEVPAGESKKLLVPEVPARESKKLRVPERWGERMSFNGSKARLLPRVPALRPIDLPAEAYRSTPRNAQSRIAWRR
jgi:hypothetical protein